MEQIIKAAPKEMIFTLDAEFEARKNRILNTKSEWSVGEGATVYYIANDGDDANEGTCPCKPFKTFAKINTEGFLKAGDVVLFKRGDRWDARITATPYVTYSAYGEGEKPLITGSIDASSESDWEECAPYIYKYTGYLGANSPMGKDGFMRVENDVGNIVINDGEFYLSRVLKYPDIERSVWVGNFGLTGTGKEFWHRYEKEFHGGEDLEHDFEYYFDFVKCELFVRSNVGNPGKRFDKIDLCMKGNVIRGTSGVILDNLAMKYGASHGMGAGTCENLVIRNCVVEWIGGGIQFITKNHNITRFGNAIEIYGGCQNYKIYNNYINQIFDCGPTVQWQGELKSAQIMREENIEIYGNAIERCDSPMEVWLTTPTRTDTEYAILKDIRLYDNFCRNAGYGFGGYNHQKADYNAFYGAGQTKAIYENAFVENNFIWNLRLFIWFAVPTHVKSGLGFNWRNNVIIKPYDSEMGLMGANPETASGRFVLYNYNDETVKSMLDLGAFSPNRFYHSKRSELEY